MPDELVSMTIGPLVKSMWITCGTTVFVLYTKTKKPSKAMKRLVEVALYLYFPGWFRFRHHSHVQDGSKNFNYLVESTQDLPEAADRETAQLSSNPSWLTLRTLCSP